MLGIPVPLLSCMAAAACLEAGESRTHAAWSICSSRKCPWVMPHSKPRHLNKADLAAGPEPLRMPTSFGWGWGRGYTRGSQEAELICPLLSFTSNFQDLLYTTIY